MKTKFTYLWMVVMTMVLALGFTSVHEDKVYLLMDGRHDHGVSVRFYGL